MDEPDIQNLIKKIAETGAGAAWVAELIAEEQEAEAARRETSRSGLAAGQEQTAQHRARARNSGSGDWPRMKALM